MEKYLSLQIESDAMDKAVEEFSKAAEQEERELESTTTIASTAAAIGRVQVICFVLLF